jgi:hypothetical protein
MIKVRVEVAFDGGQILTNKGHSSLWGINVLSFNFSILCMLTYLYAHT